MAKWIYTGDVWDLPSDPYNTTLYEIHCIMYDVHCTMYDLQYIVDSSEYSVPCTLYCVQSKWCGTHTIYPTY